eukprot:874381-Prorocentrum_minimum.AAC.3
MHLTGTDTLVNALIPDSSEVRNKYVPAKTLGEEDLHLAEACRIGVTDKSHARCPVRSGVAGKSVGHYNNTFGKYTALPLVSV